MLRSTDESLTAALETDATLCANPLNLNFKIFLNKHCFTHDYFFVFSLYFISSHCESPYSTPLVFDVLFPDSLFACNAQCFMHFNSAVRKYKNIIAKLAPVRNCPP